MRKLLLLAIALPIHLLAQTTFAPIGAKWTYEQGTVGGPDTNLAVLEVTGDSLVGGHLCSKLTLDTGWFICYEFVPLLTMSGDSLFYWNATTGEFHLLFNWAASVGDTWSTPITQSTSFVDTLDWMVSDTAHVVVDGLWLKSYEVQVTSRQWTLFSPNVGTITERLGGLSAPFTWVFGACDAENFIALRCYDDPDITWLNPLYTQCDLGTGINEVASFNAMAITPTLIDRGASIHIAVNDRSIGTALIEVRDVTGRLLDERPMNGGSLDLAIGHAGLLTIALRENGSVCAVQRIVAQ